MTDIKLNWYKVIKLMKDDGIAVNKIVYELAHDRTFIDDMGYDYANPDMKKLIKEIEEVK
jgi:hypothetical protein